MAKKKDNTVLIVAGVAAVGYLLYTNGVFGASLLTNPIPNAPTNLATLPPGTTLPATVTDTNVNPQGIPTDYGINIGSDGVHAAVPSNYAVLCQYNPNLLNPKYQLTAAELTQYKNNYMDIQQGVATWPGGLSNANLQKHWTQYGVAQQRIYLPMVPISAPGYVAPPVPPKAKSSGSWITTALQVAGSVAIAFAGPNDTDLNAGEINIVNTSAAVMKKILPFYLQVDTKLVDSIENKIDLLVSHYAD